ncbi:hypothetical protein UFOVP621_115 [uncultured Caudovirales phage]|uniref:Uncharacterized protein n=1 Tax=uncultured Caudovirales phage TaxID=2100421 RepID=A0A6J5NCZ9_9CAUD|nr:hypothetical protein UFOVP621_115 [uncultured Caudovirales phage]
MADNSFIKDKATGALTCRNCGTEPRYSIKNKESKPALMCPTCSPERFSAPVQREKPLDLKPHVSSEISRRQATGTCPTCNAQLGSEDGECPIHGSNLNNLSSTRTNFNVSSDYAATGRLGPNSTLGDFRHFAQFNGGVVHAQGKTCPWSVCSPEKIDHKDRVIVHWDARDSEQKNPNHRRFVPKLMVRTHRSSGVFRSDENVREETQTPL